MKRRVLFFANSLYEGGAEKVLQTLLQNLNKDKFDVTLYSLHKEDPTKGYPSSITYKYLYGRGKIIDYIITLIYKYFNPFLFYRLFVRGKYDTEVAFIEGYSTRIVSGSTNKNSKKIAWVHIDLQNNHWTDIAFRSKEEEYECYHRFDVVVGVSQTVKAVNDNLFPKVKSSIYIYNPVPADKIKSLAALPTIYSVEWDCFVFVACGRIEKQKGFDRLIDVAKELLYEGYKFKIVIIGKGTEKHILEKRIKEKELDGCIDLVGYQMNPFPLLKHADCFVCSSRAEGFSLVVLEAMILGLPIVSTDCAGPNELIGNSEYGLLVDNSVDGIYNGMKYMLDNVEQQTFYQQKSLERAQYFGIEKIMQKIENVLE